MNETRSTNLSGEQPGDSQLQGTALLTEPFACPACGQMLASTCRVCVACKQPIDPREIVAASAAHAQEDLPRTPPAPASVPFPWTLFFVLLAVRIAAGGFGERRFGLIKVELVLAGLEMLCAIWVFYDASRRGLARPLRWALGSLLLWPIVFPWYLARRRSPQARCPFVEGAALPIVILLLAAIGILIALIKGPIQ